MSEPDFTPNNLKQVKSEFFFYLTLIVLGTIISFVLMGNQGVFTNGVILLYYILYLVYNFIFLGFAGFVLFTDNAKKFLLLFHNFDYSAIQVFFRIQKTNVLYKILNSFFLSLIFWHILFLPLLLLQFIIPRETAILILPVTPQIVFPIIGLITGIIFTIFPAATGETGLLLIANSLVQTRLFRLVKNKKAAAIISLILISVISGFGWLFVHGFVSQGAELNQQSHLAFGVEQGLLIVLTGSASPAIALHDINLLFWGIQKQVGEFEFLRYALPITIVLVWTAMIALIYYLNKKKR